MFHHSSIVPYKSVFIAENELWVISPFMAYGRKYSSAVAVFNQTWSTTVEPVIVAFSWWLSVFDALFRLSQRSDLHAFC